MRELLPVAVCLEQGFDGGGFVFVAGGQRLLARLAPDLVEYLVLEYAGQPGLERRAAGEPAAAFKGCQQGFLHHVFGLLGAAQLDERIAQQIRAVAFDVLIGRCGQGD